MKIYCGGCNNELWWDEDDINGETGYYVFMCDECDSKITTLKQVVSKHFKDIESGAVAFSANVLASKAGEKERKIASQQLKALNEIELALKDCGVME